MTILRSREIISKKFLLPSSSSSSQTLKPSTAALLQPSTPKKLHESSSSMSSSTPPSDPTQEEEEEVLGLGLGLGFESESVSISTPTSSSSGTVPRRRSLRLATKSKIGIENDGSNNPIVTANDGSSMSSGSDDTGIKGKSGSKRKSRVLGSGKKKGKVFDQGVSKEVMGEEEDGEIEVEKDEGGDLGKLSSSTGSDSFRRRSERLVKVLDEKEKKELEIDLNVLPLDAVVVVVEEGNDDLGFSSLPTSRNAKRKIEVIDVDDSDKESESRLGDGNEEVFDLASLQLDLNLTFDRKGKGVDLEILEKDPRPAAAANESSSVDGGRKYSKEEKGKGALIEDNWLSIGHTSPVDLNLFPEEEYLVRMTELRKVGQEEKEKEHLVKMKEAQERELLGRSIARTAAKEKAMMKKTRRRVERQRHHDIAKENAVRFARFQPGVEMDNRLHPVPQNEVPAPAPAPELEQEIEDWPGPFSTALKIIKDRDRTMKHNAPGISSTNGVNMSAPMIDWTPSKDLGKSCSKRRAPLLLDLCLHIVAKNAEAIVSLNVVPDTLRHKLSHLLCGSQRMDCHFMELLASGSPTEIRVKNCSWITEEQIIKIFEGCDTNNLMVLQLDLCGRCMPDYILKSTLAHSPNSLPALASISLKGACRLTDVGLKSLVTSAARLNSINLSQCSLISSSGINHLADSLRSFLRELYLDDGQNIDMALILPALKKLEHLEVLSLAGIGTVCDDLVCEFVTDCGKNMKELNFADCGNLTDTSLKAIAENCSELCALDLSNVRKLTDSALGYLANGCRSIQTLKLCRNAFSDKAVAAFLEVSGDPLTELSLNNVKKVGHNTALSLARRCSRNLRSLDLSWCRNLADPAVGLIVDNCSSLRMLKLFGCTQITKVFVDGHSNPLVRIVGLNLTPILEHLDVLSLEEGPLRYSSVPHCT